jgi:hypothetical protein
MPSLSFDKSEKGSQPIAIVRGGDFDGQLLYLHQDEKSLPKNKKIPKAELDAMKFHNELKDLRPTQKVKILNILSESFAKGVKTEHLDDIVPQKLKDVYDRILKENMDEIQNPQKIHLPDDSTFQIVPSPDPKKREIFYIAGASGSGKSYLARSIAENYLRLYPHRSVYLISKLKEDETLDNMKIGKCKRINVDTLITDYPELEEFKESLVLFDDYDTFDKPYDSAVLKLIDDIGAMGRHYVISMCCMTHMLTNYKKTRLILNEASHFCVYPQGSSFHALKYLLQTHIGMDPKDIATLKKFGRWVCIYKNYPQWLLSEHDAKLLNE